MAQVTIDIPIPRAGRLKGLADRVPDLAARLQEHREIRRWLRRNPPSLGRATGARV